MADDWVGEDTSVAEIEREIARLRDATSREGSQPILRTSVMTHVAWVPPEWKGAAEGTLAGMAERHPSRTLLLFPTPGEPDGLGAKVSVRCFPIGDSAVCGEVIELALRGNRSLAPASIVLPLLISDLPVFCRWRGQPPFGDPVLDQLVEITDRLIVDSAEWGELRLDDLATLFERTAVSDLAWARTMPWRLALAGYWPSIREQEIHVAGPPAEGELLRGWLAARLDRAVRRLEKADSIAVRLGGEEVRLPTGAASLTGSPSDLLSAELDRYGPDPIYEEAVRAAAA
ncbi:MAG: glucose-6-phosphate dehydrogenase assembly protein OpcA [Gaiellaceae bacterium]